MTKNFFQEYHNNINQETSKLTSFIKQATRSSIPVSDMRSNKNPVPRLNVDYTNCLKALKIAEKACMRSRTEN